MTSRPAAENARPFPVRRTQSPIFVAVLAIIAVTYVGLLLLLVAADTMVALGDPLAVWETFSRPEIQHAVVLSIATSVISVVVSMWIGTAIAWLVSRSSFRGRNLVDFAMDLPLFLPPLVIGISLLIFFRQTPARWIDDWMGISFEVPAILLAQTLVATAFVYRTMKGAFDRLNPRQEMIARSLGATWYQAFLHVTLPQSTTALRTAAAIAWARAFGEFGPILIFAGSFRGRTEVLPVSIYLEMNSGNLNGAVAIALLMIVIAAIVLTLVRCASRDGWNDDNGQAALR